MFETTQKWIIVQKYSRKCLEDVERTKNFFEQNNQQGGKLQSERVGVVDLPSSNHFSVLQSRSVADTVFVDVEWCLNNNYLKNFQKTRLTVLSSSDGLSQFCCLWYQMYLIFRYLKNRLLWTISIFPLSWNSFLW